MFRSHAHYWIIALALLIVALPLRAQEADDGEAHRIFRGKAAVCHRSVLKAREQGTLEKNIAEHLACLDHIRDTETLEADDQALLFQAQGYANFHAGDYVASYKAYEAGLALLAGIKRWQDITLARLHATLLGAARAYAALGAYCDTADSLPYIKFVVLQTKKVVALVRKARKLCKKEQYEDAKNVVLEIFSQIDDMDYLVSLWTPKEVETPSEDDFKPIFRMEPRYPQNAIRSGTSGYVLVDFTITRDGTTNDIRVLISTPPGVFDREAIRAATKFRYRPKMLNGEPVDVKNIMNEFIFEIVR